MDKKGTPLTWPLTAESVMLMQSERLVVDRDEAVERALMVITKGMWVQEDEQEVEDGRNEEELVDIEMEGATTPEALGRNLTPAFQAANPGARPGPLPLAASRHAHSRLGEETSQGMRDEEEEGEEEEGDMDLEQEQEFLLPIGDHRGKKDMIRNIIETWENLDGVMGRRLKGTRVGDWIDTVSRHIIATGKALELKYASGEQHGDVGRWDTVSLDCGQILDRMEARTSQQFVTRARGYYQRTLEIAAELEHERTAFKVGKMEAAVNLLLAERGLATHEENKRSEKKKKELWERNEVKRR